MRGLGFANVNRGPGVGVRVCMEVGLGDEGSCRGGGEGNRVLDRVSRGGGSGSSSEESSCSGSSSSESGSGSGVYDVPRLVMTRIFAACVRFLTIVMDLMCVGSFSSCSMRLTSSLASMSPCIDTSCLAHVAGYLDIASATMLSGPGT